MQSKTSPTKTVVITGSTRGIGFGMAGEFLKHGCQVMISGRSQAAVDKVVAELSTINPERIAGYPCDVTKDDQLQGLWDAAVERFGQVDIWINNAAINLPLKPITKQDINAIRALVETNLIGVMSASKIVLNGMLQQGHGHLYNMEGSGSNGRITIGMTPYGTTKYALTFFTKSLMKEMRGSSVKVSLLSPGIVITDMWDELYREQPERWERTKSFLNILGDHVETVAAWLVDHILRNDKGGNKIAWLTTPKIIQRFLLAPFRKRDLFSQP